MTLRRRILLLALGVMIFLIIAPIIVFFARGFLFDFKQGQIIKTGTLIAKTQPTKAQVFINDKPKGKTPDVIRFLIPGDYVITIKKDGFLPWTKRLSIKAQLATAAHLGRNFITLFYSSPKLTFSTPADLILQSKDLKELIYVENNQLYQINLVNNQQVLLGPVPNISQIKAYSPILDLTAADEVYTLAQNLLAKPLNLSAGQLALLTKIQTNGQYIAATVSKQLFISDGDNLKLINPAVNTFTLDGETLWYLQGHKLVEANLKTGADQTIYENLPAFQQGQIIKGQEHIFLILDNTLYSINDRLEKIYSPTIFAFPDPGSGLLLIANNNELLLYNPEAKELELILRSISQINKAVLNAETGYMFFQNEGKIKAIELDGRDHRNVYNIVDALENFAVSQDGKILYTFSDTELKSYGIR